MLDETDTKDRTLTLTRHIPAPVVQVWAAWTDPDRLQKWWGPRGFTCRTHEIDLRDGGLWRFDMIAPDGTVYANRHRYRQITPMTHIDYAVDDDGKGETAFEASVRLEPRDDGTQLTLTMVMESPEAKETAEGYGAVEHGYTTLDCLAEAVLGEETLSLTRVYAASRKAVWAAWTDPKALARWFVPDGCTMPDCSFDMREGGRYDCVFVGEDSGNRFPMGGDVLSLTSERQLVFTHGWKDEAGHIANATEVTVTLEEVGPKTRVTMLQRGLPDAAAAASHCDGWGSVLDHLGRDLA